MDNFHQSLLNWGIEHSNPEQLSRLAEDVREGKRPDLNPELLKQLMGKSDADKMKEYMDDVDAGASASIGSDAEERALYAWENLECLVEDIDNASDLDVLQLWPRITAQLVSKNEEFVKWAAWVVGTAVQNNPRARKDAYKNDPVLLKTLVDITGDSSFSDKTRAKSLYALGSLVSGDNSGAAALDTLDAWTALYRASSALTPALHNKAMFTTANVLTQDPSADVRGIVQKLVDAGFSELIVSYLGQDRESDEWTRAFRLLCIFVANGQAGLVSHVPSVSDDDLSNASVDKALWDEVCAAK